MPRVEKDIERRWEQVYLHDERSECMVDTLATLDLENGNKLGLLCGNDIDLSKTAERLKYLLDIYFEMKDITSTD